MEWLKGRAERAALLRPLALTKVREVPIPQARHHLLQLVGLAFQLRRVRKPEVDDTARSGRRCGASVYRVMPSRPHKGVQAHRQRGVT